MSHQDFINQLYGEYLKDSDEWVSNPEIVTKAMNQYYNNPKAHYELLRLILYKLDNGEYNKKYFPFLKILLFTLLEENAISLIYREKENSDIYFNPGLNNILKKYPEIFLDEKGLSFSNTQLNQLIDKLEQNSVIEKIKENRNTRKVKPYGGKKRKKVTKKKLRKKRKSHKKRK
tara:strand:- start:1087 stop:1608 length:522 start_codon:yes stop_codon:yes gene_type:complete